MEADKLLGKLGRALSKGERRRVQTSVGLMIEPRLFLFDEPFDGLDIRQATGLGDVLLNTRSDMGMIVSSHQMSVIERLADIIIVLKEAKVATYGSAEHVSAAIAGKSATLHLSTEVSQSEVIKEVRSSFPDLLVQPSGQLISLTGKSLETEVIQSYCREKYAGSIRLDQTSTSLDFAMAYFLSKE